MSNRELKRNIYNILIDLPKEKLTENNVIERLISYSVDVSLLCSIKFLQTISGCDIEITLIDDVLPIRIPIKKKKEN